LNVSVEMLSVKRLETRTPFIQSVDTTRGQHRLSPWPDEQPPLGRRSWIFPGLAHSGYCLLGPMMSLREYGRNLCAYRTQRKSKEDHLTGESLCLRIAGPGHVGVRDCGAHVDNLAGERGQSGFKNEYLVNETHFLHVQPFGI